MRFSENAFRRLYYVIALRCVRPPSHSMRLKTLLSALYCLLGTYIVVYSRRCDWKEGKLAALRQFEGSWALYNSCLFGLQRARVLPGPENTDDSRSLVES